MRGYFEIGVWHSKNGLNLGTLWRSAMQLGASGVFVIGKRYQHQASDTPKAIRHIPLRQYRDFEGFNAARPHDSQLVMIEMGGKPLTTFKHPDRAIYLLGAEDYGIPDEIRQQAQHTVTVEATRIASYNVAVAGSIVMWHRVFGQRG